MNKYLAEMFLVLSFFVISTSKVSAEQFSAPELGISYSVPTGWSNEKLAFRSLFIYSIYPNNVSATEAFTINILFQTGSNTIDVIAEQKIKYLQTDKTSHYKKIRKNLRKIDNIPAYRITYNSGPLRNETYFIVRDKVLYEISYSYIDGRKDYRPAFDTFIQSIRFTSLSEVGFDNKLFTLSYAPFQFEYPGVWPKPELVVPYAGRAGGIWLGNIANWTLIISPELEDFFGGGILRFPLILQKFDPKKVSIDVLLKAEAAVISSDQTTNGTRIIFATMSQYESTLMRYYITKDAIYRLMDNGLEPDSDKVINSFRMTTQ